MEATLESNESPYPRMDSYRPWMGTLESSMSDENLPVNKGGRPSKFNETVRDKILELAEEGKTEEQIAEIIGIHVNTLRNWKGKHPTFLWALKESKGVADDLVEASLFQRAIGYTHPEEKVFCHLGQLVKHQGQKHIPPDVTAQIFWLKNRRPDEWREKQPGEEPPGPIINNNQLSLTQEQMVELVKLARGEKK
jgi:hypothetical protein